MLRIIVADDSKEDLVLIERVLQKCKLLNPVTLVTSSSGCIGELQKTQPSSGQVEPCLLLLDLIMAPESGLDVLRHLQKSQDRADCLVVMLSGLRDVKAINEGYQLGAKTFLLKPVTPRDLVELVNSLAEISIEESEAGYALHWKERLTYDSELRHRSARIRTLSA